jgi:TDG/mug DNA glycosylase family protein
VTGRPPTTGPIDLTHLAPTALPLALADVHRSLEVGAEVEILLPDDHAPTWSRDQIPDLLCGAGFGPSDTAPTRRGSSAGVEAVTRLRTLPDTVGPDMRLLVVGLNPSLYAADQGVGFGRPGNRFWPAALAAGLVTVDRDPRGALVDHGIGMTDLVKRATVAAAELHRDEYREGARRLDALVAWLQPGAVCVVGLTGWRAAIDRKAVPGRQPRPLGGRPVHLMPNTSGLNAGTGLDAFVEHLRAAWRLAGTATSR